MRGLLATVGLSAAAAVGVLAVGTRSRALQTVDDRIESAAIDRRALLLRYASVGTLPGEPWAHWLFGVAAALALVVAHGGQPWRYLVSTAAASAGAIVFHHAVKAVYRRPRPAGALARGKTEAAFPSGHTADATAALLTSAYILVDQGLIASSIVLPVAVVLSLSTGVSRVALGWHWATDVLGGWFAGLAVAAGAAGLYEWLGR